MPIVDGGKVHITLPRKLFFPDSPADIQDNSDAHIQINNLFTKLKNNKLITNFTLTLDNGKVIVSAELAPKPEAKTIPAEKSEQSDTKVS
jgi:hypothetical protein